MLHTLSKKIIALSLCLLPLQAFAESSSNSTFKVGLEAAYYHYDETSFYTGSKLMRVQGPMFGVNADYFHDYGNKYFVTVDGRALVGVEKYDGSLQNGTPHHTGYATQSQLFEARVTPGYQFENFDFYAGLGYRLKADAPKYANRHGYPRQSHYLYIPVGIKIPTVLWGAQAYPFIEYDLFLQGRQVTDLTRFGGSKFSNHQHDGFGVKTGIVFKLNKFDLVPYINYWNIDHSDMNTIGYEPANTTWEIGIKINFLY